MENENINVENVVEKKENEITTIRVKKETLEKLKKFKQEKEKMWQVIERLCNTYEAQMQ